MRKWKKLFWIFLKELWEYCEFILLQYKTTHYKIVNVKLSKSQFDQLKSAIKNEAALSSRLSSNVISDSNDKTNFPHKSLLTDREV